MTPADAVSLLRVFDVYVEPTSSREWRIRIPWAIGTALYAGEEVSSGELVELADAIVSKYSDIRHRSSFRTEILQYLFEETHPEN